MVLPVIAFYASLLALCYLYLSFLVIGVRRSAKISLGDGGNEDLRRLTRAHANFNEYVPITLILIACLEANFGQVWGIHLLACCLLFGRLLHAYGLRQHEGASWQRLVGMLMTFSSLFFAAVTNLIYLHFSV